MAAADTTVCVYVCVCLRLCLYLAVCTYIYIYTHTHTFGGDTTEERPQIFIMYYLRDIILVENAKAYTAILCILSQASSGICVCVCVCVCTQVHFLTVHCHPLASSRKHPQARMLTYADACLKSGDTLPSSASSRTHSHAYNLVPLRASLILHHIYRPHTTIYLPSSYYYMSSVLIPLFIYRPHLILPYI